jgi:methylmalonyl-CoA/ethylmalonyl-CoA epimerase
MKLGQLILFTGEVGRLAAFYRDVLGLTEVESEPGWCVLDAGDVKLAIHGIPVHIAGTVSNPPEKREDSYWKPTFLVDDLDGTLARCREAGLRLIDETPRLGAEGKRIAFIHPSATGGTLVELTEL